MEKFLVVFLFITLIKLSHQIRPNCTIFGQTRPVATELSTVAWEMQKIQAKYNIPILADYSDVPNREEVINKDLSSYEEGIYGNEDALLTISQLVDKYGFLIEQHNNVITKDGYLLTLHRIPKPGHNVVFLHHGLMGSSIDWFMAGKDSLPLVLASVGYDVWLGNFRGNRYSMAHISLTPDCAQFWDFSYDEFGCYDMPASLDYIRSHTRVNKLTFIGHSVSTTAFFVMASLFPDYNKKISSMIAMSPMAWSTNVKSPVLRVFAANEDLERTARSRLGPYEFKPSDLLTSSIRTVVCANNPLSEVLCNRMAFLVTGFNHHLLNMSNFYAMSQHFPSSTSTKTFIHYIQNVASGQFRRYDYPDVDDNIVKYKSMIPTDYPVENITAKVSLFISNNDYESNENDVKKLSRHLSNLGDMVYVSNYSAVDYLLAKNVRNQVYDPILMLIRKYMS